MYMKFLKQAFRIIIDNPVLSTIVIIGTAVTMAFVILVTMVFQIRVADMAPESRRSRSLYLAPGEIHHVNGTNYSHGLGKIAYEGLLTDLPGVDGITFSNHPGKHTVALPGDIEKQRLFTRNVAPDWFEHFDYKFIAGQRLTTGETREHPREAVVSASAAKKLFKHSRFSDMIGQEILVNFRPVKVSGIFEDVSSTFTSAYADVLLPFVTENDNGSLQGARLPVLFLEPETTKDDVMKELEHREVTFNNQGRDYVYHFQKAYNQVENCFFKDTMINASMVYVMLMIVLLIVPALGIAGLINAQIQSRASEIAIKKAYGAPDASIIFGFFRETLVCAVIGTILGYSLAVVGLMVCKEWMFGDVEGDITITPRLIFNNGTVLMAVAGCIIFSIVATLIPAWIATRRNIAVALKGGEA